MSDLRKILTLVISILLLAAVTVTVADAQTKKKKRRHVRHPAAVKTQKKPAQTSSGDAGVVSLADQYQDGSNQIIDPKASPSPETTDLSDDTTKRIRDMQTRIKRLESANKTSDEDAKQKRLMTNLDILTKAEERSGALRKERFELAEKENAIRQRLDQIDIDIRPEMIERAVATTGSLRPEELREAKRKSLEAERRNLQTLLNDVTTTRASLDQTLQRADAIVEKLRDKLEKDINDALDSDKPDQKPDQ